jgi:hypothetical protein
MLSDKQGGDAKMKFKWPGWTWIGNGVRTLSPIPLTLMAAGLTSILWVGGWPAETAEQRIQYLGIGLLFVLALLGLALFLVREGIKSFSVKAGAVEIGVNEQNKDDNP